MQGCDPRFRLFHTWIAWSYLRLEKIRNHQNTARFMRQQHADSNTNPTAANLLRRSQYTNNLIIDEDKTMPLPTFIRTGDSYFHEKELHVNAMVTTKGLPQLFITLSETR